MPSLHCQRGERVKFTKSSGVLSIEQLQAVDKMIQDGMTTGAIANALNVTPGRISQIKYQLKNGKAQIIQIEKAGEITDKHIDAAEQLSKVNRVANRILDKLTNHIEHGDKLPPENQRKDSMELVARYCQEIRAQLSLQMDIYRSLYDIKIMAAFQQSVLEAINEVSPETKDLIVQKLKEARMIRPNLQL